MVTTSEIRANLTDPDLIALANDPKRSHKWYAWIEDNYYYMGDDDWMSWDALAYENQIAQDEYVDMINEQAEAVKRAYPGQKWKDKVDGMKPEQVSAIHARLSREGRI